jgi:hypothetical protein
VRPSLGERTLFICSAKHLKGFTYGGNANSQRRGNRRRAFGFFRHGRRGRPLLPTCQATTPPLCAVLVRGSRGSGETNNDHARTNKMVLFTRPDRSGALGLSCWKNTRGNVMTNHPENPLKRALSIADTLRLGFVPVAALRLKQPDNGLRLEMSSIDELQDFLDLAASRQAVQRTDFEQGREALMDASTFTLPETFDEEEEEAESEPCLSRQLAYAIGERVCDLPAEELTLEQIGFAIHALSTEPGGLRLLRENISALRQISTCIAAAHGSTLHVADPLKRLDLFVRRLTKGADESAGSPQPHPLPWRPREAFQVNGIPSRRKQGANQTRQATTSQRRVKPFCGR